MPRPIVCGNYACDEMPRCLAINELPQRVRQAPTVTIASRLHWLSLFAATYVPGATYKVL